MAQLAQTNGRNAMNAIVTAELRGSLERDGVPGGDLWQLPTSPKRFPDGAHYRVEIPSTEGPDCLRAVLQEADELGVTVHRVSQGSGCLMLSDRELDEMIALAADARVEVSLFARPCAAWSPSAMARTPAGSAIGAMCWGQDQIVHALQDIARAARHGARSVLIADIGLLSAFNSVRHSGVLPRDMQAKVSVALPVANASAAAVVVSLGGNTINVPTDLSLPQLAAIRAAVDVPLDIYIEAPDSLGGFVRTYELPEIVRICSPVYIKFGLRNAPDLYPTGQHLGDLPVRLSRERVRRARLNIDRLSEAAPEAVTSAPGAAGAALVRDRAPV